MELAGEPGTYRPRACDCDFCRKHAAAYVSDPHGKLVFAVRDETQLSRYRQGSGIAYCLVCGNCGVLVGICYEEQGRLYATVNRRALGQGVEFAPEAAVSPRLLGAREKIERWKNIWFADVHIKSSGA
jgi:hypothetical protein